jgi:hypothetical protein
MCFIPVPFVTLLIRFAIMAVIVWSLLLVTFDLDYVESFQLGFAIVAVEIIGYLVVAGGVVALMT